MNADGHSLFWNQEKPSGCHISLNWFNTRLNSNGMIYRSRSLDFQINIKSSFQENTTGMKTEKEF